MYDLIAIHTDNVTRYFQADGYMDIYDYMRSLGYDHYVSAEVSSWALFADLGEIYSLGPGAFCEIRANGDSNI